MTLADLTPAALLAAEETGLHTRRQADVDAMLRLLAWCDLHSIDPQTQPGATPISAGGDRLRAYGGDGTPAVSELCFAEFAIAGHAGVIATSNKAADALDLRHRLPQLWDLVQQLRVEVWVARKIAGWTRTLDRHAVALVDAAVAAGADLPTGKLLELAEAKVIEADPAAHRERIKADEAKTGIWKHRRRIGQAVDDIDTRADVQGITVRLSTASADELTTTIDDIATILADQHVPDRDEDGQVTDLPTMDHFRTTAIELLTNPHAVIRLLEGITPNSTSDDGPTNDEDAPTPKGPVRQPRSAVIHVHISAAALAMYGIDRIGGVARVEGLGPMLLEQLETLLHRRDITVKPVIDLNLGASVDSYEHPTACKERTLLRTGGDVFPHSTTRTRRLDHDHPTPYVPPGQGGPPGQTGDHNDAPLTRRHHRAKTHLPYQVRQLALGAYRWETPHGLLRVTTRHGTTVVEALRTTDGTLAGEIYPARAQVVWAGAG